MSDGVASGQSAGGGVIALTPCHNDGWALPELARSMRSQTRPPVCWVVIDDASTDTTPAVLERLAQEVPFLRVLRRERPAGRRIGEKARAVMAGAELAAGVDADHVAVVDADVVLPTDYFERVQAALEASPALGVTGGVYREDGGSTGRAAGAHVPGPAQVFRRSVWAGIGGYQPLRYGGDDVESVVRARMLGWRSAALADLPYQHRRRMGTGGHGSALRADRNLGRQDYDLGTWPLFEAVKVLRHVTRPPAPLAAAWRAFGYLELAMRRRPRSVDDGYVRFVRAEQRRRLAAMARLRSHRPRPTH
ncbi:MAG: glycosyltransferase family 2 protein [Vicinamibacterales bacterium]